MDNTVEKIDIILSTSVRDIKTDFEKTFEQNVQSLKNYIRDFMQQLVNSPDNWIRNSTVQETTKFPRQNVSILQNNIYEVKNRGSAITERKHSEFNHHHNGVKIQKNPTSHLNHTPLAYYMDSHEKFDRRNSHKNFRSRSNSPANTIDYKEGFCFKNLHRNVATPLAKFVSPFQDKVRPQTHADFEPKIKRRNNSIFQNTTIKANKEKYGYKEITPSRSSTPAFSVTHVTKLAKEYTSHQW